MDVNDINGDTPLHVAASNDHVKIVTMLLDAGADLEAVSPALQYTPLGDAIVYGAVAAMKVLVARGAAVNPSEVRDLHHKKRLRSYFPVFTSTSLYRT
jgi:ankyrin repeat protein